MNILKIAADLFVKNSGNSNLDVGSVIGGLKGLLPTQGEDLDMSQLVSMFTKNGGGLAAMAQSWLGDGGNSKFDVGDVLSIFGDSKVENFASQLGMDKQQAASGLSNVIPQLIDSSSEGGSIVGDIGAKLAKGALSRFF